MLKMTGLLLITRDGHEKSSAWFVVVTAMEAKQLAAQRQTHLGCRTVPRYCYPSRESGRWSMPHRCSGMQESISRWIRLLRLNWLRGSTLAIWGWIIYSSVGPARQRCNILGGLMIEGWTWLHRLAMIVKHVLQPSQAVKASLIRRTVVTASICLC